MACDPTPLDCEGLVMADGCAQPAGSNADFAAFLFDTVLEPFSHGGTKGLGSGKGASLAYRGGAKHTVDIHVDAMAAAVGMGSNR